MMSQYTHSSYETAKAAVKIPSKSLSLLTDAFLDKFLRAAL